MLQRRMKSKPKPLCFPGQVVRGVARDESLIRLLGICPYFVNTEILTSKPKVMQGLKSVGAT